MSYLWNPSREVPAASNPHADLCLTGWQFADARGARMIHPFIDNCWESDHRGHCLDATEKIPAGSMISYSSKHVCPLQVHTHREA